MAPSGLSSLIGSVFGSATPAYKTADGAGARAPAQSASFWSMFAVTPSYKTAPAAPVAEAEDFHPGFDEDACASDPDRGPDRSSCCSARVAHMRRALCTPSRSQT